LEFTRQQNGGELSRKIHLLKDRHPAMRGATGELSKQKTPSNAPFCLAQFSG